MQKQTYKIKIISSLAGFLLAVLVLFLFVFPQLLNRLESRLAAILSQKKTVLELRQEQRNIELAKQDLQELQQKALAPADLFSKDTTLVSDLAKLERKAKELNISLSVSVTGTVGTATKAKTASELFTVPFSIQLVGRFGDVVAYTDYLEHAASILTVRSYSLSSSSPETVSATLAGWFYLRK